MNQETDLITKLNQPYNTRVDTYNGDYNVTGTNTNSINIDLINNALNLDCGITLKGKEYTVDDLVELLELKEMLKKLHPEIFLVA